MKNRRLSLIRRAYRILDTVTPIEEDCGKLCQAKCCSGGDHDGMWLLPDEELLLQGADFLTIRETLEGKYAICQGTCDRAHRPFSCRIYPYFPMLCRGREENMTIKAVPDVRALSTCPLFQKSAPDVTPQFLHAVRRAGRVLMKDRGLRAWLDFTGKYILDVASMREMLEKE